MHASFFLDHFAPHILKNGKIESVPPRQKGRCDKLFQRVGIGISRYGSCSITEQITLSTIWLHCTRMLLSKRGTDKRKILATALLPNGVSGRKRNTRRQQTASNTI